MGKEKIITSVNSDDSYWLEVYATDHALDLLEDTIGLDIEDDSLTKHPNNIQSMVMSGCSRFTVEKEGCIIYVIINHDFIDLIIRKTGNHEKIIKNILKHFEYVKHDAPAH